MKDKSQIQAILERSMRKQVTVPRLGRKFNAGVWARIESAESRGAAPALQASVATTPATARWLNVINVVGLAGVVIVLCVFGSQMLSEMNLNQGLPQLSVTMSESVLMNASMIIATVAVAFGLMFTPWGRRLRDEFV